MVTRKLVVHLLWREEVYRQSASQSTLNGCRSDLNISERQTNMVLKGNAKNETFLSNNKQYELSTAHGIILFVISVPSLFTNLAAILAAVWLLKLQPLSPNMFVLVLSCLDFAGVLCCGLPSWLVYITGKWRGGRLFCNFHGFVLLFFSLYSGSLAMCMAIDRCIAVRKPFYHRRVMTVQRSRNVMLFVTILTFVFSMPPLFIEDGFILSLCGTFCTINWFSKDTARIVLCNVYAALGGFLLLGALLSNANVVFVLHKRKRQKISIIGLSSRLKSVAREKEVIEKQFSKMMVLLSIVFAFCWCPFMVSNKRNTTQLYILSIL